MTSDLQLGGGLCSLLFGETTLQIEEMASVQEQAFTQTFAGSLTPPGVPWIQREMVFETAKVVP